MLKGTLGKGTLGKPSERDIASTEHSGVLGTGVLGTGTLGTLRATPVQPLGVEAQIGIATETDTAFPLADTSLEIAVETDTAFPLTAQLTPNRIHLATETDTAGAMFTRAVQSITLPWRIDLGQTVLMPWNGAVIEKSVRMPFLISEPIEQTVLMPWAQTTNVTQTITLKDEILSYNPVSQTVTLRNSILLPPTPITFTNDIVFEKM